jgi:glycosyltransferase involved in cell wall biosynthesis
MESFIKVFMMLPYFIPQYGGAELQAYQLALALNDRKRCKLSILTLSSNGNLAFERLKGLSIYRFRSKSTGYEALGSFLSKQGSSYNGFHQHLIYGADPYKQLNIGRLAQEHGLWQIVKITSSEKVSLIKDKQPSSLTLLKNAHAIVAINKGIAQELLNANVSPEKIIQIPNGVDTHKFTPISDKEKKDTRIRLGLPLDKTVFIFVGRIVKKKGLDFLLQAWGTHEKMNKDTVLLILGDDSADIQKKQVGRNLPCYLEYKELSERLGLNRVFWLGSKSHSDLQTYYQASDCLILPSRNEGSPNVVLEAMSSGLPIIGTKIPGILDLIESQHDGLLVDLDEVDELAHVISLITDNVEQRKSMGKMARKKIMNKYDISLIAKSYLNLYQYLDAKSV